jgi:Domain of unknown function (DUF6875)
MGESLEAQTGDPAGVRSLERKTLWLAPERIAHRDMPEVVEVMDGDRRLLLDRRPADGDDVVYNVIVVVFSDPPADRAKGVFDEVLKQLGVPSYREDEVLFGPYFEGNETPAIHNTSFRPGHAATERPPSRLLPSGYAACLGVSRTTPSA